MNGIIIIDKPAGWTSHDVIGKLRGILHERRIGHAGTLDPMATGVLPVFVGRATRAVEFCEADEKEYVAGLRPGIVTDTQDTTGTVLEEREHSVKAEDVLRVIPNFLGEQDQIPPMYSAIKVGGKKLYDLARKGVEVERKPRRITIKELSLEGEENGDFILRCTCSKGTYIRTLVSDMGDSLGCGAAMSSLRRVRSGVFTLDDTVTLEDVQAAAEKGEAEKLLRTTDSLFASYPEIKVGAKQEKLCRNGNTFAINGLESGIYRVYSQSGAFLMLGEVKDGNLYTVKSFFEVD